METEQERKKDTTWDPNADDAKYSFVLLGAILPRIAITIVTAAAATAIVAGVSLGSRKGGCGTA